MADFKATYKHGHGERVLTETTIDVEADDAGAALRKALHYWADVPMKPITRRKAVLSGEWWHSVDVHDV